MPISFANIPANIKVPLYWVEVDPSMAGLPNINLRALLVGIMTTDGDATPDVPIPIGSQAQADQHFGLGSELSRMFAAYYANNFANEVWGLPVSEPVGATAATGTIGITDAATAAGTIHLYICGVHVPVNISTTDTTSDIASAIEAAINADDRLPVTATISAPGGSDIDVTSLFKGINGNEITVSLNYYGSRGGENTPVGLGITLPANGHLATGVGVPVFTTAISNLGEEPFEYVAMPYTDSEFAVRLGSGIRLHRQRSLGLAASTLRPRVLSQARPLRRPSVVG